MSITIISGWIGFVLVLIGILAVLLKERGQTLYESFIEVIKAILVIGAFGCGIWLLFYCLFWLINETSDKPVYVPKPTILVCNNIIVAESVDGFRYSYTSGTYSEYGGNSTYTPRQGEVCRQYLKEK